ncbi:Histone-lysine N-methyltransferase, H3 lysine-36 specific [Hypsizygus marmoreus]|uniref:Histone-lysine N-methyltransferase, H3 lysine-36 specific n=1 Tax=Hypsizygus marmoreus TaxID=39966 RepID=A0A369JQJ5_HYPMA|nr:Histone-lysine N-methyltransferase, H3 lysine-36 specific [Hypsizygus marmoreus]
MSKLRRDVKKEESRSPSLGPTGSTHDSPFPVPPLPLGTMSEIVKHEELKKEERLSPFSVDIKTETKAEDKASPSMSPTLNDNDMSPQKFKLSPSPTPPPPTASGTASMSSTPPPNGPPPPANNKKKAQASVVQLIGNLPIAREDALATFNEILENNYQYKTLGRSREVLESMTCDCIYEHNIDDPDVACGPYSDCINRLTQVECLPDDCRCRSHCQNQRFQNREYADIEIVLTEKKGFGLRAESDLPKDAFIYEYVGDVVNPASFKKRMRDYAEEGIQHFYFMMLQKDEFIDATKSGGIGRFANHSCQPNCYVAKWTVGNHVRMGIFAKRNIKTHEELTFNYNVDRYGHQAQICYCGEPNCVGYIGGKTQTDIVTMDDLYLDALGITDEADLLELKGSKKKKGKKIDDPDFMAEKDVPKVVQAIRQTQSRKVLYKLLTRIKMTEDQAALRQIMRLRGYSLMTNVLDDYASDTDLITLAMECMSTWPLLNRNKVEDSKVIDSVRVLAEQDNETVKDLAESLIDHWIALPLYNRIPKRVKKDGEDCDASPTETLLRDEEDERRRKRSKYEEEIAKYHGDESRYKGFARGKAMPSKALRQALFETSSRRYPSPPRRVEFSRESIKAVIAAAAEAEAAKEAEAAREAAERAAAEAEAEAKAKARAEAAGTRKKKPPKKVLTEEEKEANKEKRLLKLVGAVVVKCMSKHSKAMDHDMFKKHAKELTQIIADKEKKSSSYKEGKLDKLSDEKIVKIKKFSKEYITKILRKLEKSSGKRAGSSSSAAYAKAISTLPDTPNSTDGVDVVMADMTMSVEEAMDMGPESGSEGEGDGDDGEGEAEVNGTGSGGGTSPAVADALPSKEEEPTNDPMDLDEPESRHHGLLQPSDPRRRPPHNMVNGVTANS